MLLKRRTPYTKEPLDLARPIAYRKGVTLAEIETFLLEVGAPSEQVPDMARQLDNRARQMAEKKRQTYDEALAYLVGLMKQGWAAQERAKRANGENPR